MLPASFEHQGLTLEGPFTWLYHSTGRLSLVQRDFICGPKSIVASIADSNEFYLWRTNSEYPKGPVYADLHADQTTGSSDFVELERGYHKLQRLIVLRPSTLAGAQLRGARFEVLAHLSSSNESSPAVHDCNQAPNYRDHPTIADGIFEKLDDGVVAKNFWKQIRWRFEVRPDRKNEWKIPIPDELAQAVRKALKKDGSPKPASAE